MSNVRCPNLQLLLRHISFSTRIWFSSSTAQLYVFQACDAHRLYHYSVSSTPSWTPTNSPSPPGPKDYTVTATGKPSTTHTVTWTGLTVPLFLIELILVMDLDKVTETALSIKLAVLRH